MSIYLQTEKKLDGYISNMTTSKRTNKLVRFSVARCIFYKCIIKMIKNTSANSYGTLFLINKSIYKKWEKKSFRVLGWEFVDFKGFSSTLCAGFFIHPLP